jgi:hypothetical protein
MLQVIRAFNQRGWSSTDHLLDDSPLEGMVGRNYKTLRGLKQAAQRLAKTWPTVEYTVGGRTYRYNGSPTNIPGRQVQVITELR